MENEENQETDRAAWTIKSMPVESRKQAIACAVKQGQTMAEWLVRAVANQANLEAGERVLPPVRLIGSEVSLPIIAAGQTYLENGQTANLDVIGRVAGHIRDLAAAGVPISKVQAGRMVAALTRCLPQAPAQQAGSNPPHQQQHQQDDQ